MGSDCSFRNSDYLAQLFPIRTRVQSQARHCACPSFQNIPDMTELPGSEVKQSHRCDHLIGIAHVTNLLHNPLFQFEVTTHTRWCSISKHFISKTNW